MGDLEALLPSGIGLIGLFVLDPVRRLFEHDEVPLSTSLKASGR